MACSAASFEVLEWDSHLFGFPVARVPGHRLRPDAVAQAVTSLRAAGIRLAYAVTPWHESDARAAIERAGGRLVDRKVRYRKAVSGAAVFPARVEAWTRSECTAELEALALESGQHSRFRTDPRVPPHVYPGLYLTWIRRSVRGELARVVLVSGEAEVLTGMITLDLKETRAEVGLMAVHAAHRRAGVGLGLMEAAEAWAHAAGAETLEVVTQGANVAACTLYQAAGCVVAQAEAVYHLWLEPAR